MDLFAYFYEYLKTNAKFAQNLKFHAEVCGWSKKFTWLNLETIILLWGEANIFKLFKNG